MSIEITDNKLKTRLAQYGSNELFGDFNLRSDMRQDELVQLFDKIWESKLQGGINEAAVCDSSKAYLRLTDREKKFFDHNQEHRQFRLQEEGLEFIAQIRRTSTNDEGSLTQFWRVSLPDGHRKENLQNAGLSSDTNTKRLHIELSKKEEEARQWSKVYYKLGDNLKTWYFFIGAPVAVLAILAGSSFLLNLLGEKLMGIVTLLVGVLAALQTFLDLGRRSEKFEAAGKGWGKLARKIGEEKWAITFTKADEETQKQILNKIIEDMNALEDFCPIIPIRIYKQAEKELERNRG